MTARYINLHFTYLLTYLLTYYVVKHQPISNRLPQAFNAVRQQSMLTSQIANLHREQTRY